MVILKEERLPSWLRRPVSERVARGPARQAVGGLYTVCEEARCPNRGRCLGEEKTATFLLLGPGCTRDCGFCAVRQGASPPDAGEPARVARAAAALGLNYVVLTSTTRDDLADGGAAHFAAAAAAVKAELPAAAVEVLTPDFSGSRSSVEVVARSPVAVFGHNVETVPRLYGRVRPGADYGRSLRVLSWAADAGVVTKSALMVGLGETAEEVDAVFADLRDAGVAILAVGQYLRPGRRQLAVAEYWEPAAFERMAARARAKGFAGVAAAPFVRSSYGAAALYAEAARRRNSLN